MSMYDDWKTANSAANSEKQVSNVEFVLKSIDLSGMKSITYTALADRVSASKLRTGQKYLISDFQTIYTQPITNAVLSGSTEPLVVTALSTSTLEPIAFSPSNPYDVVYYDILQNNTSKYAWATSTDKGQIYRRITKNGNDLPYDVRAIKFRRYQVNVSVLGSFASGSTFSTGTLTIYNSGVYIALQTNTNVTPSDSTAGTWKYLCSTTGNDSYIGINSSGLTVPIRGSSYTVPVSSANYKDFYTFDDGSGTNQLDTANVYSNEIAPYVSSGKQTLNNSVFIGNYFHSNTIGNYFYYNTIGNSFYSNTIGNSFYSNTIGSNFYYNTIGSNFHYNTIGSNFQSNTIGNSFYSNTIGSNFYYNTIGNYFYYNRFGDYFTFNTMTAFTSATNASTAVRKNVFENGIGKESSYYGKVWPASESSRLQSDYCVTYYPASNWTINSSTGSVMYSYIVSGATSFTVGTAFS